MKKTLALLVLLALVAIPLAAQVTFGLGPGVQYSGGRQLPLSLAYDRTYRCTAIGEMWVNVPVGWILSLRPGLMYAEKEFNVTVVYDGRLHRTTPGTFRAGWAELPLLLVAQPTPWFHVGAGGYGALAVSRSIDYTPITSLVYETPSESVSPRCHPCPPPPPPPPVPIPNGNPVLKDLRYDWGYMVVGGFDWYITCPTFSFKNSIEFSWSRGLANVFSTYDRRYRNETLACSYVLWF